MTTVAAFWSAVVDRLNTDVIIRLTHLSTLQGALRKVFLHLGHCNLRVYRALMCDETLPAILERALFENWKNKY